MKKSMLFLILFLSAIFLVSCSKSPQEKIVGEWMLDDDRGLLINADGNIKGKGDWDDEQGTWELTNEEPLVFKILEGGKVVETWKTIFINDDEVEFSDGKGKSIWKRKK